MRTFSDRTGRQWKIDLTIGDVERIKSSSSFNLYEPNSPIAGEITPLQQRLISEWSLLWELVYRLIEPQALEADITAEAFGREMGADNLISARHAFFEEWRDFFLSLQEPMIAKALAMELELMAAGLKAARLKTEDPRLQEMAENATKQVEQILEDRMDQAYRNGPGNLLALPE